MRVTTFFISALVLMGLLSLCVFTVYETDKAILLRLGKIYIDDSTDKGKIYEPGLHFKVPFVDTVNSFDTRLHIMDTKQFQVKTFEKKDVEVDVYVQWRIEDVPLYYIRTGGSRSKTEALIQDKATSGLVKEFGALTIKEVVFNERVELMARLRRITNESTHDMGVAIHDFRIKRINFTEQAAVSVHERMIAERVRIANDYRARGEKTSLTLRAAADKTVRVILAEAEKESERIRGEGDSAAVDIYAGTYNKDPEFYEFYRSLDAYKNTFRDRNDVLVLKPEGEFFKYFRGEK